MSSGVYGFNTGYAGGRCGMFWVKCDFSGDLSINCSDSSPVIQDVRLINRIYFCTNK